MASMRKRASGPVGLGLFFLALVATPARIQAQIQLPRDQAGWTAFDPGPDTRILYVSSSGGDDATAAPYLPDDPAIGADPFQPATEPRAFRTLAAALGVAQLGVADWVLLRRGDAWAENLSHLPSGRGPDEPAVIGAYGPDPGRPLILAGLGPGVQALASDLAIVGLEVYAQRRDPDSPDFVPPVAPLPVVTDATFSSCANLLVEDCCFRFLQVDALGCTDAEFRRCLFLDNYAKDSSGYASGFFAKGADGLTLEECTFDHSGWSEDPRTWPLGEATVYQHHTYTTNCKNVELLGNLFLRSASIGNKIRSEATGATANVDVRDNLYYEGEVSISTAGNSDAPYRFKDMTLANNVMIDVGRARPTGRRLAVHLDLDDLDGGAITNNLMIHNPNPEVWGCKALTLNASARNVVIKNNIAWDLPTRQPLVHLAGGSGQRGNTFNGNIFQSIGSPSPILWAGASPSGYTFRTNIFTVLDQAGPTFQVAGQLLSYSQWRAATGDTRGGSKRTAFPNPGRTLESYQAKLGGQPSIEDFLAEVRQQSRADWRPEYTAGTINDYLRAGYGR